MTTTTAKMTPTTTTTTNADAARAAEPMRRWDVSSDTVSRTSKVRGRSVPAVIRGSSSRKSSLSPKSTSRPLRETSPSPTTTTSSPTTPKPTPKVEKPHQRSKQATTATPQAKTTTTDSKTKTPTTVDSTTKHTSTAFDGATAGATLALQTLKSAVTCCVAIIGSTVAPVVVPVAAFAFTALLIVQLGFLACSSAVARYCYTSETGVARHSAFTSPVSWLACTSLTTVMGVAAPKLRKSPLVTDMNPDSTWSLSTFTSWPVVRLPTVLVVQPLACSMLSPLRLVIPNAVCDVVDAVAHPSAHSAPDWCDGLSHSSSWLQLTTCRALWNRSLLDDVATDEELLQLTDAVGKVAIVTVDQGEQVLESLMEMTTPMELTERTIGIEKLGYHILYKSNFTHKQRIMDSISAVQGGLDELVSRAIDLNGDSSAFISYILEATDRIEKAMNGAKSRDLPPQRLLDEVYRVLDTAERQLAHLIIVATDAETDSAAVQAHLDSVSRMLGEERDVIEERGRRSLSEETGLRWLYEALLSASFGGRTLSRREEEQLRVDIGLFEQAHDTVVHTSAVIRVFKTEVKQFRKAVRGLRTSLSETQYAAVSHTSNSNGVHQPIDDDATTASAVATALHNKLRTLRRKAFIERRSRK